MKHKDQEITAPITAIQRFCVHDGPGIRTVVFFKGCPLRCQWCQNPETIESDPELAVYSSSCILCGLCVIACPVQAISLSPEGDMCLNSDKCSSCGTCARVCYAHARKLVGRNWTVDQVLTALLKDITFYKNSGGGVTLSGGEVSLYPAFASSLLRRLKECGVRTAIETCGYANWKNLRQIIQHADLVLFDIKHSDPQKHRQFTGNCNSIILENLKRTCELGCEVVARVPLIPGFNDDEGTIREIAQIAIDNAIRNIDLLPFHQIGQAKWAAHGKPYEFMEVQSIQSEKVEFARAIMLSMNSFSSVT
ncbi:MAG: glycyl-radical enzyme activating protein, partial [Desulforhabdus sp.]|nr:glycyl-radical enzyme activating protein [Desulforhabdus sp.]